MNIMNRGKVKSTDGIELPSNDKIRQIQENAGLELSHCELQ